MAAPTHADYVHAAHTLWGDAGVYVYRTFDELNDLHFDGDLPALPIVIGITAFGHCIGLTRPTRGALPRITLASNLFDYTEHGRRRKPYDGHLVPGRHVVRDVLLHEMIHAHLSLEGLDVHHNAVPWCE